MAYDLCMVTQICSQPPLSSHACGDFAIDLGSDTNTTAFHIISCNLLELQYNHCIDCYPALVARKTRSTDTIKKETSLSLTHAGLTFASVHFTSAVESADTLGV